MIRKDSFQSWIVLFAVTFSLFLEIETIKSFSVLLLDIKEQFGTSTLVVGCSISIISGCGYCLGVSSGAIVNALSPRLALILSGVLASVGLLICSIAAGPGTLLIGEILTGFLLVQENVAIGVVPYYFDKYYEMAVGIYSCGTGLGIVVMPGIAQLFLDTYGWRGTLLLLSGLAAHSIPFGAILTQTTPRKAREPEADETTSLIPEKCSKDSRDAKPGLMNGSIQASSVGSIQTTAPAKVRETDDTMYDCIKESRDAELGLINGSINASSGSAHASTAAGDESSERSITKLLTHFGAHLQLKPTFITQVFIPGFSLGYVLTGWMIYMVTFAVSQGTTKPQGAIVATCGGVGVTVIRLLLPILHKFMSYKQLFYASSVVSAISVACMPFFHTFNGLCVIATISGMGIGLMGAELYISAGRNSEESEHYHAIAWAHLLYGIASYFTGFVTGLFYDLTGCFDVSFYILGLIALLTAASLAVGDYCILKDDKDIER